MPRQQQPPWCPAAVKRRSSQPVAVQRILAAGASPLLVIALGLSSLSQAVPAAAIAPAAPAASIDRQVRDAKSALTAASQAAEQAHRLLEQATAKIPTAQDALAQAQAAVKTAQAAVAQAEQGLAQAKTKIEAQKAEIAKVQGRIDELVHRIEALARQAYMNGGSPSTIQVLLQTTDPTDFSLRLESQRRTARSNSMLFEQTTTTRDELDRQLGLLKKLQEQALADEAETSRQAEAAVAARNSAAAAEQELKRLVASREEAATTTESKKREAKALYQKLLEQQARSRGYSKTSGTLRSAAEAVSWALGFLGQGSYYDGLCLGFVDDAYGASSGRVGTAIAQWYRALDAGKGHLQNSNPPIGAQVFWWSGNPARHVAIYAGNGMVISTGVDGDRVGLRSMEYFDSYGPYLGWAEPYYG